MTTYDFIVRVAVILASIIIVLVFLVAAFMVYRDGNTPDVVKLEDDIVTAIQWIGSLTAIIVLGHTRLTNLPKNK